MSEYVTYLIYGVVVISALFLGKWYARERDRLMARGEPWVESLKTTPGILILVVLAALILVKVIYN